MVFDSIRHSRLACLELYFPGLDFLWLDLLRLVCIGVFAWSKEQDGSYAEEGICYPIASHCVFDTVAQGSKAIRSFASMLIRFSIVGLEEFYEEGGFAV